ncbi:MAG: hypothetical protein GXO29_06825 [Thermotogae bacterium]|nr:hypothetical protein [Thermotogota bacterium]
MRIDLDRWEVGFLLLSLTLLLPWGREILFWLGLPNLFSPFFAIRDAINTFTSLRIQRDELLNLKSRVVVVDAFDSTATHLEKFKGFCYLLDIYPPYYPERMSVRCDSTPEIKDLLWAVGLVGRVVQTEGNVAEVITIHSKDFYMKVKDERSNFWGILQGGKVPKVRFVPRAADVREGDTLVAYDHPGIFVGTVMAIVPEEPFLRLEVQPLWRYYIWTKFVLLKPRS